MTPHDKRHITNLAIYERKIQALYRAAIDEAAKWTHLFVKDLPTDKSFFFKDFPLVNNKMNELFAVVNARTRKAVKSSGTEAIDDLKKINSHDSRKMFRKMQSEARKALLAEEHFQLKENHYYSKRLYLGKTEKKALIAHCFNAVEIKAVQKLPNLLKSLKNGRYEPINMNRSNYKKKMKNGVRNFVVYEVEIDGVIFELKCEAIKYDWKIIEHPYSLKIKKE